MAINILNRKMKKWVTSAAGNTKNWNSLKPTIN